MSKPTGKKRVTKSRPNAAQAAVKARAAGSFRPGDPDDYRKRVEADKASCQNVRFNIERRDAAGNLIETTQRAEHPGEAYLGYIAGISQPDLNSTILIEIAAYCDPELRNTIEAALKMAGNPERIHFAICFQDDDVETLKYLNDLDHCAVKHFWRGDAPGTCAARYWCQQLYAGEDFVFHVDSHMRFARYWDVAILDQWNRCGDKKAILSSWGVDLRKQDLELPVDSNMFNYLVPVHKGLLDGRSFVEGPGIIMPSFFVKGKWDPRFSFGNCFYDFNPRPGAFICAHYLFGPGRMDADIPVDRYMDFTGDELAMSVRYYTGGYNIYHPGAAFIYHLWRRDLIYGQEKLAPRGDAVKVDDTQTRMERQMRRVEVLLGLADHPDVDLIGFELGSERTLQDYEEYCGLSFARAEIARFASEGHFGGEHTAFDRQPIGWHDRASRIYGGDAIAWARKMLDEDPEYGERRLSVRAWAMTEENKTCGDTGIIDLKVAADLPFGIVLSWLGNAGSYTVQGVKDDVSFETISTTSDTSVMILRKTVDSYCGFRISACGKFGTTIETSRVMAYGKHSEALLPIRMRFAASYGGKTCVSFMHEGVYAQYCLYDITDGAFDLVAASEDFMLTTDRLVSGHVYAAMGYVAESGIYVLKACSDSVEYTGSVQRKPLGSRKPVLSVVMPVCNTEKYLARAIDSVLCSTLEDIEFTLVDDGSTDASAEICEWYARKYDFIRLAHTDHIGPSAVRNVGVDISKGEWLAFIDSDDMIHPYAYEKLYDAAVSANLDVAVMQVLIRKKFGEYEFLLNPFGNGSASDIAVADIEMMLVSPQRGHYFWYSVCNKIVRMDIAREVRGPEKSYFPYGMTAYEDLGYTPALYSYADRFAVVRGAYYVWEQRHKLLLGAQSYYWGESSEAKHPFASQLSRLWGLIYASEHCDPERRHEVDFRVMCSVADAWKKYKTDYAGRSGFDQLVSDFASAACRVAEKYSFRTNPYIKDDPALLSELDDLQSRLGSIEK